MVSTIFFSPLFISISCILSITKFSKTTDATRFYLDNAYLTDRRSFTMKLAIILVTVLGLVLASSNAFAETDSPKSAGDPIFMQYQGITGDASKSSCSRSNAIELNSFQWGVGRGISSPTGGSSDRESSAPSVSEIVVTKDTDSASVPLLKESLNGEGKSVKIDFCRTAGENQQPYLEYNLQNTLVSKYSISSGGDRPTESISLNFVKIQVTFFAFGPNGTPIATSVAFDLAVNQVS